MEASKSVSQPIIVNVTNILFVENEFVASFSELSPRIASGNHLITGKCEGVSSHGYGLEDPQHFYLTTNKQDFGGNHGMPAPLRRYFFYILKKLLSLPNWYARINEYGISYNPAMTCDTGS